MLKHWKTRCRLSDLALDIDSSVSASSLCSAGESAADRSGSVGEMVRPGLQHQRGGGGHRRGRLPVPGGHSGAVWGPEAPPGPALLRILSFVRSFVRA